MKHSLKNTFPLYRKTASFGKKNRKWFPLAGKCSSVKIDSPLFQSWFPNKKRLRTKAYCFHWTANEFPLAGMKDSLKNMFSLDVKVTPVAVMSEIIGENGFHLPEIKFILAGIRFCINSPSLQNTTTVATHKTR